MDEEEFERVYRQLLHEYLESGLDFPTAKKYALDEARDEQWAEAEASRA